MKKSFTLIEILIALVIFSFVYFTMTRIINYLDSSESFIKKIYIKNSKQEKLLKTLYTDILESKTINIIKNTKNFSELNLTTTNSLYNFSIPFVEWKVNKKKDLIRIEAITPIKKATYYVDNFGKVNIFRVFHSGSSFFVFIQFQNKKNLYFKIKLY